MPDQPLGGQVHCVCIKVRENTPRKPCIQRQRRAAIDDAIFIRPPNAGKAGMPVVVHGAAIDDRHRIWAKLSVQRLRQPDVDRKRVVKGKSVLLRVKLGGRSIMKKKKKIYEKRKKKRKQ